MAKVMMNTRYRTSYLLWFIVTSALFTLAALLAGSDAHKGDNSLSSNTQRLMTGHYHCSDSEIAGIVLIQSVAILVPSAILGWTIQAVAVVLVPRKCPEARG